MFVLATGQYSWYNSGQTFYVTLTLFHFDDNKGIGKKFSRNSISRISNFQTKILPIMTLPPILTLISRPFNSLFSEREKNQISRNLISRIGPKSVKISSAKISSLKVYSLN